MHLPEMWTGWRSQDIHLSGSIEYLDPLDMHAANNTYASTGKRCQYLSEN